jgi:ribosome-binding factor A
MVTITDVKLTADLRNARVFFTLLADGESREAALAGLTSATPFLRRELAQQLELRHTPELVFAYDTQLEGARRIDSLLRGLHVDDTDKG